MADSPSRPVRVFISYSHDSTEHEEHILTLCNRLRADGVDAIIDQGESPPEGWPLWMERQIDEADFVLLVCTATYRRRIERKEEPTKGRGVVWEINSIYNRLYVDKLINIKFIPILFEGSSVEDIPFPVKGFDHYDVSSEAGYESLFRRLTNQPLVTKAPLGPLRILPPKQRSEESLPGAFSLEQLSKTMSNPKYAEDIYRLDRTWRRSSVIDRETIIIVVGTNVISELLDRSGAELLRDEIDRRGAPYPFRRGIIVTHEGWYSEAEYIKDNAVIAIGGPKTNKLTDEFDKIVPGPGESGGKYPIPGPGDRKGFFRKNSAGLPQVALWGKTANDTRETVEHYMKDPMGLKVFLSMCWK
jgi:TIR domain